MSAPIAAEERREIGMAKAARFPRKLEVWVPDAIANGFELLAQDQMLTVSDHARQALQAYLRSLGISTAPARPAQATNGHQQQEVSRAL
jgi:hypothetical protein